MIADPQRRHQTCFSLAGKRRPRESPTVLASEDGSRSPWSGFPPLSRVIAVNRAPSIVYYGLLETGYMPGITPYHIRPLGTTDPQAVMVTPASPPYLGFMRADALPPSRWERVRVREGRGTQKIPLTPALTRRERENMGAAEPRRKTYPGEPARGPASLALLLPGVGSHAIKGASCRSNRMAHHTKSACKRRDRDAVWAVHDADASQGFRSRIFNYLRR